MKFHSESLKESIFRHKFFIVSMLNVVWCVTWGLTFFVSLLGLPRENIIFRSTIATIVLFIFAAYDLIYVYILARNWHQKIYSLKSPLLLLTGAWYLLVVATTIVVATGMISILGGIYNALPLAWLGPVYIFVRIVTVFGRAYLLKLKQVSN